MFFLGGGKDLVDTSNLVKTLSYLFEYIFFLNNKYSLI